jgi:hypothetical protein
MTKPTRVARRKSRTLRLRLLQHVGELVHDFLEMQHFRLPEFVYFLV